MRVDEIALVVGVLTNCSWLFIFVVNFIRFIKFWVLFLVMPWSVSNFLIFAVMNVLLSVVGFCTCVEIIILRFGSAFHRLSVGPLFYLKVILRFAIVSFLRARIRIYRILIKWLLSRSFYLSALSNLLFSHFEQFIIMWPSWMAITLFLRRSLFLFRNMVPRAVMKRSIILISTSSLALIA